MGAGTQGSVYLINIPSQTLDRCDQVAVKFHHREVAYNRELGVFLRLQDLSIDNICGHRVPLLTDYDDDLLAIAMTVVSPPFCLDFGGAYLDQPPDYSPEVWDDWEDMKSMAFEDNWPHVKKILSTLQTMGIFVADVNPANIKFE